MMAINYFSRLIYSKIMNIKRTIIWHILKKVWANRAIYVFQLIIFILILSASQTFAGISLDESSDPSQQQEKRISGKLTDQAGAPLPGVSVVVKGTTTGTVTDANGYYTLANIPGNATLIFSFVGMKTREMVVGNQTTIDISLLEESIGIDEVISIGYGTQKKSHLTGAISKVTNEGLEQIPTSRIEEALIGKVSGVSIQMVDASAGSAPTIRVRGVGSITADASPLIVMDGVVVSSDYLGSIDMNDIQSVEVLKDAASAAIYGSRGGNGVIMITTKKGTEGKTLFAAWV